VISSDIAQYILSEFDNKALRLFKMEDVSMGMWVEKFNTTRQPVEYLHDVRFYQPGCFDGYFTAHYQSPQHMIFVEKVASWKRSVLQREMTTATTSLESRLIIVHFSLNSVFGIIERQTTQG